MKKVYRIVEIKNGKVKSLFHGTNGSRTFPLDKWLKADKKMVTDGSSTLEYLSGFHFLPTKEETEEFFLKLFRIRENRFVVPCYVRKNIRRKKEGRSKSWLADEIMFKSEEILPLIGQ